MGFAEIGKWRDCAKCGHTVYDDLESCMQWCSYAGESVGEETARPFMDKGKEGPGVIE